MEYQTLKDGSRKNYSTPDKLNGEQIQIGCLQRIADATETMAKNYAQLITDRDRYQRWYSEEKERRQAAERSINTYKGVVTKLKNQLKQLRDGTDNLGIAASEAPE